MSQTIIAIVGRPNVGKSTLFNRIIGARTAIVHDEPGVTRDRHYSTASWVGKTFTLIDTGGYVPASDDVFERAIREQSEIAMTEADKIIFVVDGQEGITHVDTDIADILRRSKKKVMLVVNKIDGPRHETAVGEFHRLGLGEPISLAALGGRKIGDFLDELTEEFPLDSEEAEDDSRLKLAVIGKPNVGKSSLVNALIGKPRSIVTPIAGTTRDPIDSTLMHEGEEILFIDTAGLMRKNRIKESVDFFSAIRTLKTIDRANVALVLFDAKVGVEKQDLRIVQTVVEKNRGVVLAINKWDLIENKETNTAKEYETMLREKLRTFDFIPIIFISALTRQRIFKMLDVAKMVHSERSKRIPTNELNDVLLADIAHYPPSTKTGRDVKINYITQVRQSPPVIAFFANEPQLVNENYKKFLENKIREHWGFVGVPVTVALKNKNKS
ncbi:MAG TPA: ribosome biogenesis GTPase Der [Bacteroidota bacterium]|nr:ribosome biogenesis GTPase Der [Bacteroidota bacterium]